MKTLGTYSALLPRVLMFAAMLALIVYVMHFVLPAPAPNESEAIAFNPMLQLGLFFTLTIFGALIGFWITFGDLVNRGEK
jgi:hypothetical protein